MPSLDYSLAKQILKKDKSLRSVSISLSVALKPFTRSDEINQL